MKNNYHIQYQSQKCDIITFFQDYVASSLMYCCCYSYHYYYYCYCDYLRQRGYVFIGVCFIVY